MCKVDNLALGNLGLSVVETKELGSVLKTGIITAKALSKQEFTIHQVKGAAEKIPTLNLYPYVPPIHGRKSSIQYILLISISSTRLMCAKTEYVVKFTGRNLKSNPVELL